MDKSVGAAINAQIKHELDSAYLYLSMSAYFEADNLPGMARWMRLQAQEEVGHAMRFFDYMADRGERVELQALDQPPTQFESPLAIFEQTLAHEQQVTGLIHALFETALKAADYATQVELQWFITEQVEEEKSANQVVDQLRMVGDNRVALLMLDRQLGARAAE